MLENITWNFVECFLVIKIHDRKSSASKRSQNSVEIIYQLSDMISLDFKPNIFE